MQHISSILSFPLSLLGLSVQTMGEKKGEGKSNSPLLSTIALFLWMGMIQFNCILVVSSLLFLPLRLSILVLAVLAIFAVIPLNSKSHFGRKISRFISKYAYGYFPITVHLEDEQAFDPAQAYVFGFEPHTIFALGAWALTDRAGLIPLPKIKFLAASIVFHIPFLRQIWTWLGLVPVSKKSFYKNLAAGCSCITVPGGMQEMLHLDHNSEVAFLKSRKGFVKIAIETGCPLVPVFSFGQSQAYKWWKPSGKIFYKIYKIIHYPVIISWGRFGTPIPFRVPMNIVIGKPIHVTKNTAPSIDEVNEVHAKFVAAMQELFEKNKTRFGSEKLQLRVL
ncbi:hypothetical protein LUZ60_001034 [Juncus effusus]|nr:hypothetical protein LUZ60_001034 [Juncus effusus]